MTKLIKASAAVLILASVAACSGDPEAPEADTVTETRMDEVDVIDGTISDDMVDVDTEQTGEDQADDDNGDEESEESTEAEE